MEVHREGCRGEHRRVWVIIEILKFKAYFVVLYLFYMDKFRWRIVSES